jgi:osmotically-inducible protein OsmY
VSVEQEVVKKVRAAFEREPRINLHRYPVHVDFSDGILTLDGEVEHVAAKKVGLGLAAGMREVSGIIDRLRVAPAVEMGDGAIRDHVCAALIQEPTLQRCVIRERVEGELTHRREALPELAGLVAVEVKDGVVTLNGQVPGLCHKRLAGVLAWWVPGSRDVINGLEVEPPEEDNDDEVIEAVRVVLKKDPFVNVDQIRVSSRNYVVTLEGLVSTDKEKAMAEFDAWYVFAVDHVINKLEVKG